MKSFVAAFLLFAASITPALAQTGIYVVDGNGSGSVRVEDFSNPSGAFLSQFTINQVYGRFWFGAASMAIAPNGNFYIADSFNKNVSEFDGSGNFIGSFGSGYFVGIGGIAVDANGNVWAVDSGYGRLQEFSGSGAYLGTFGQGNISQPNSIAIDNAGNIWVTDGNGSGAVRVVGFNGAGTYSSQFTINQVYGRFWFGAGSIAAAPNGDFYIGDPFNQNISVFSSTGSYLATFGNGQFQGIAVDASGNVWAVDAGSDEVKEFSSTGASLEQFGSFGWGPGQFTSPGGIVASVPVSVTVSLTPTTATLYGSQTQRFTATVLNASNTAVTWTVSPAGSGTINSSGLYTAPANITAQQTVTVTATSQANTSASASATVTLMPPIAMSVTPTIATLYGSQTQSFIANVTNTSNAAVTWTISPAGVGTIDSSGNYTAPASITAQQKVTVTAISQADTTQSASAMVVLATSQCALSSYGYRRLITIDHTKVPNTDQIDFPILVSGAYTFLATVANGGKVQNANGYDIIFTSDAAGQIPLDFEIDSYSAASGTAAFWVRIPRLSHSVDTPIYMWYGNANITASQENKAGVWKNNYLSVYHFGSGSTVGLTDSGVAGYTLSGTSSAITGVIGGGAGFSGSSLIYDGVLAYPSGDSPVTLEAWVNSTPSAPSGEILGYGSNPNFSTGARIAFGTSSTNLVMDFEGMGINGALPSSGAWHHLVGVYGGGSLSTATDNLYVDGIPLSTTLSGGTPSITTDEFKIGGIPTVGYCCNFTGSVDEVRVSSGTRSADWIAAEYNNQGSPLTFYTLSSENALAVNPASSSLYASQSLLFTVPSVSTCSPSVTWAISPAGVGAISLTGLYTAPASVTTQQAITITATSVANPSIAASAPLTLLPTSSVSTLTLAATDASPYVVGSSRGFAATLIDQSGTPEAGVAVDFTVTGANSGRAELVTNANGVATYTYMGANAGSDTIQATSVVTGQLISSNSVSVVWTPQVAPNGQFTLSLNPQGPTPTLGLTGLCGAFTDNTGAVIEPISIGALQKVLIVPSGATQLQLGVDDDIFNDNFGSGFLVNVNGVPFTISPKTMPWVWASGGLNSNYSFGIGDGTSPVIAATGLTPGQGVVVAYQSGTVSAGLGFPLVDANGYSAENTGAIRGNSGTHFATYYMFDLTRSVGEPITFTATLDDGSGNPVANTAVTFGINGANTQQPTATTNSMGVAAVTYVGQLAGSDSIQAMATPAGGGTVTSSPTTLIWNPVLGATPTGSLELTPASVAPESAGGQVLFTVLARDASGNSVPGVGVGLSISGADNGELRGVTGADGTVQFTYHNVNAGTVTARAVTLIGGSVIYSNSVVTTWTSNGPGGAGSGSAIGISIQANTTVTLPNPLQLTSTVTDSSLPPGTLPTLTWSQVNGPGMTTFAGSTQPNTTATFSLPGSYVLQLSASDGTNSSYAQIEVTVASSPGTQGWIGSPATGSTVTGIVPVTVAPGINVTNGRLIYYSASDVYATNPVVLNANVTGSGQIGTFDTTVLPNGSYYIQLQGTDSAGASAYSVALVTVAGQYKPGRVTASVTDLVVPATGLAIKIQRQYDSLNAGTSGDFGYGWSLSTSVDLSVDPSYNVTFTIGGQRRTFYFTPQFEYFFLGYVGGYTPEPGLAGSLTEVPDETNCPFGYIVPDGSLWECGTGEAYSPLAYVYTDPSGTQYTMGSDGTLKSIVDIAGNALTVTPTGVASSTGLSVPFVRDSSGRITQITDPQGHQYVYTYDTSGNLATVKYPGVTPTSSYTYAPGHLYTGGTDFLGNPLPATNYYQSTVNSNGQCQGDCGSNGLPLNGKVKSVQDALGETTSYAYNLSANTTTTTYPPDANGNVGTSVAVYDSYGMLLSSTDPLGLTTTNAYDSNHNLTSVTDPLGHTNSYTYDINGNRTSSTYPQVTSGVNTTSTTTYNQFAAPTTTTDELGNVRTYTYDSNNNPKSVTDTINGASATLASFAFNANGTLQAGAIGYDISVVPARKSQYTYDAYGNRTGQTDALGRLTSYTYDTLGHLITTTLPLTPGSTLAAETTTYTYDSLGHLTQTAAPLGKTTSSTYDPNGNKLTDTDPLGHTTSYAYDALNRLITTTYPTSPATTITNTYDFRNNIIDQTDQAGHITHHVYDLSGRLISVTSGYGTSVASTSTTTYYNDGRKHVETDADGHTTTYTYDAAGRLTNVVGVKGNMSYGYDAAGNKISSTDGNGNTTQYQYDARKRLTITTYPTSPVTTTTNTYDGPGNLIAATDQAGNTVQYNYDFANQLQSVVQVNSPNSPLNTTTYAYDPLGNLTTLTDANSHSTLNGYDLLNDLTSKTLPDGTLTETRSYDTWGNLLSLQHFNGKTTTYAYDQLNRLTTRTPDPSLGEATESFTYTPTGKYATTTDASGTTTYSYDALDRLTAKATPEGTLNYTYDAAGNVASIASSNANGASVSYTYDGLNRLSTVVDNRLSATTTYAYDTASNLVTATYPNGLHSTFTYDSLSRLTAMATPTVSSYNYTLAATGNRTNATESTGRTQSWTYDGIYRLTNETINLDPLGKNGSVGYVLDPVGNRQAATSTLPGITSSTVSFNPDDWMSIESYDANGNTISTGGRTFAYDSENRLSSMNGGAVSIVYDAFGNRVSETAGGVTTKYLVEDDVNPTGLPQVMDEIVGGAVQREYTYGLQRISENQLVSGTWTPSYYGYDGMGSVRQLTNAAGAVTDTYSYDGFGNMLGSTGSTPNNYLYRGEQYDPNLNLYYLRHRYYNPATGRFVSRDLKSGEPIDPRTLHKYLYADGDPVDGLDPRGLEDQIETTEVNKNNLKVIFGHGFRHLVGTGLTPAEVEPAIEAAIQQAYAEEGTAACADTGIIAVQGIPIVYRLYLIDAVNLICNVGTYFPL